MLIVCPLSSILVWKAELKKWLPPGSGVEVFECVSQPGKGSKEWRDEKIKSWFESGGVMIIGNDMIRNLTNPNCKFVNKTWCKKYTRYLANPGPHLVVLDEGHLLKNEKTALFKAMSKIKTRRRVVLTGNPLQNNLPEYHCMIKFIKPNLVGNVISFDENQQQVVRSFVNQFKEADLTTCLPHPKYVQVLYVKNSNRQSRMYKSHINPAKTTHAKHKKSRLLSTHPEALVMAANVRLARRATTRARRRTRTKTTRRTNNYNSYGDVKESGKLTLLMEILRYCESIDEKVLVFCQSPTCLVAIEKFLKAEHTKNKANRASPESRSTDVSFTF